MTEIYHPNISTEKYDCGLTLHHIGLGYFCSSCGYIQWTPKLQLSDGEFIIINNLNRIFILFNLKISLSWTHDRS